MIGSILELADKERKASEPYKNLFKKTEGKPLPIFLSEVEREMTGKVLDAIAILEERGIKVNNEAYYFLLALPLTAHVLEKHIQKTEGSACCVDKTYHLLEKEFNKLLYTPHT